jgi:glycine cleavage system H protein
MQISRREFIKDTGLIVGGAAVGSMGFLSACAGSPNTSTETPTSSTQTPTASANTTTTTQVLTSTDAGNIIYIASREGLVLKLIPGCTSFVATDRKYTVEHMWVKSISGDRVVIGITDKMQQMMERINQLQLPQIGEYVSLGEVFGYADGDKLSVDLIAPVSGTTVQVNNTLWASGGENKGIDKITGDPYVTGWMIVVQLSKPEELNQLITYERYSALNAKA